MIFFLIGIILVLTVVIVLVCIRIRAQEHAHRGLSGHHEVILARLKGENSLNAERLRLSDALQKSMFEARRELDRRLLDALS